ncbi:hypothetical protein CspHIS471_0313810 [Cutaneotrichosporon sp. HIS471]|nr:hypothetical protein CspHIS471_0313810 [Cutaneotrichosporon sp. HIS471]
MLGALAIAGLLAPVAAQYVSPFSLRDPDVYFNLSIPAVSPFFTYRGNWSDGGPDGLPMISGPTSNMSFYGAGSAAWVYTHSGAGSSSKDPPASMIVAGRSNPVDLGGNNWVFPYRTNKMAYTFALINSVPANDSLQFDSVTIESGLYTEAKSWEEVHCVTESFTKNSSLELNFQGGAWTFGNDEQSAWGGAVKATLPQNTSFVWVNASAVSGPMNANTFNLFMTRGITPLNFQQMTLNSLRSYEAKNMIVYQAPLDPTDRYELTLSAPGNNQIILNSITYCSYYMAGKVPTAKKKSNAALIGGLVGGLVGGFLILAAIGTPDAFIVDESAETQPLPDKRMLGSMAVPRSSSPTQFGTDSSDLHAEYEAKLNILANGGSRDNSRMLSADNSMSGDRTMSGDSYRNGSRGMSGDSSLSGSTEQKSMDPDGMPRRPRRQRRTRHVVEHAEDGGEIRVENGEEVVVEVLPPVYQPEWEERRRSDLPQSPPISPPLPRPQL